MAHRFALLLLLALPTEGCARARTNDDEAKDAAVTTTTTTAASASEADAGFVSAAAELVVDAGNGSGGARALAAVPPVASETIAILAGTFATGSTPGDERREAAIEPALVDAKLGAFSIDALPYPNDPTVMPRLVTSQREAAQLCSEQGHGNGGRLCTELEWERACKGPNGSDIYPSGASWNAECDRAPSRCASGFGVRGMGFMREWTDSHFGDTGSAGPVIRGATHRCASRSHAGGKDTPSAMAFRCCHGDRNDIAIAPIEAKAPFKKTNLDADDLAKIFKSVPELSRISEGVRIFSDSDVKSILSRSGASSEGISFATSPIFWSPEPGIEVLVATGRAKKTGFVVALWRLPNDKYRFASSFLLLNDAAPVALAYEPSHRKELRWTTCWGCAGEQGTVSVREDGRIVIVQ